MGGACSFFAAPASRASWRPGRARRLLTSPPEGGRYHLLAAITLFRDIHGFILYRLLLQVSSALLRALHIDPLARSHYIKECSLRPLSRSYLGLSRRAANGSWSSGHIFLLALAGASAAPDGRIATTFTSCFTRVAPPLLKARPGPRFLHEGLLSGRTHQRLLWLKKSSSTQKRRPA
jgi:hypothetical protein